MLYERLRNERLRAQLRASIQPDRIRIADCWRRALILLAVSDCLD